MNPRPRTRPRTRTKGRPSIRQPPAFEITDVIRSMENESLLSMLEYVKQMQEERGGQMAPLVEMKEVGREWMAHIGQLQTERDVSRVFDAGCCEMARRLCILPEEQILSLFRMDRDVTEEQIRVINKENALMGI